MSDETIAALFEFAQVTTTTLALPTYPINSDAFIVNLTHVLSIYPSI